MCLCLIECCGLLIGLSIDGVFGRLVIVVIWVKESLLSGLL